MGTSPSGNNPLHVAWGRPQAVNASQGVHSTGRDLVLRCSLLLYSVRLLQTSAVTALGEEHEAAEPAGEP